MACPKVAQMETPQKGLWNLVPGYETDSDSDSSDEELNRRAAKCFTEVVSLLGNAWEETPTIKFDAAPLNKRDALAMSIRNSLCSPQPGFRVEHADAPVVLQTLLCNGLRAADKEWVLQWSGPGIRDAVYQDLTEQQRVNHFPASTELTRKDRLWLNFRSMARLHGPEIFDFMPHTFVLPEQLEEFQQCFHKEGGMWIVKPTASSRGRGIFLLRDLKELPPEEGLVVSQYIQNPLLIQGLKFDIRVYVLVTGYEPFRAYIYREGLVRFASKLYSTDQRHRQDVFRHLTNYSINKDAVNFIENDNIEADNVGHKWSISALNKHLACVGVDAELMWTRIMDLIVKSLLTVEPLVAERTRILTPLGSNCFELYGFDILVDSKLKPWLLEVNLSPSMQADSPLDWQIKGSLMADALNLVGIPKASRPRSAFSRQQSQQQRSKNELRRCSGSSEPAADQVPESFRQRLEATGTSQLRALARALLETKRVRNFIRLYPTKRTVRRYAGITTSGQGQVPSVRRGDRSVSAMLAALLCSKREPAPAQKVPPGAAEEAQDEEDESSESESVSSKSSQAQEPHAWEEGVAQLSKEAASSAREMAPAEEAPLCPPPIRRPASATRSQQELPATSAPKRPQSAPYAKFRTGSCLQKEEVQKAEREIWLARTPSLPSRRPQTASLVRAGAAGTGDCHRAGVKDQEVVRLLGLRDGCRLVLLEYLIRIDRFCSSLSLNERLKLDRAGAYHWPLVFQRRVAARLPLAGERSSEAAREAAAHDSGPPIPALAKTCRDYLVHLVSEAWQALSSTAPPGNVLTSSSSNMTLHQLLPPFFSRSVEGRSALDALANLGATELEHALFSPQSSANFRDLLQPVTADRSSSSGYPAGAGRAAARGGFRRPNSSYGRRDLPKVVKAPPQGALPPSGPLSELLARVEAVVSASQMEDKAGPGPKSRQASEGTGPTPALRAASAGALRAQSSQALARPRTASRSRPTSATGLAKSASALSCTSATPTRLPKAASAAALERAPELPAAPPAPLKEPPTAAPQCWSRTDSTDAPSSDASSSPEMEDRAPEERVFSTVRAPVPLQHATNHWSGVTGSDLPLFTIPPLQVDLGLLNERQHAAVALPRFVGFDIEF